jgi:hypothetical protein
VASTGIVADVVSQIGGDHIDLVKLLPVGTDPHSFTPTPQDLIALNEAHVVFINGMGLEEQFRPILDSLNDDITVAAVNAGVETIEFAGCYDRHLFADCGHCTRHRHVGHTGSGGTATYTACTLYDGCCSLYRRSFQYHWPLFELLPQYRLRPGYGARGYNDFCIGLPFRPTSWYNLAILAPSEPRPKPRPTTDGKLKLIILSKSTRFLLVYPRTNYVDQT